LAVNLQTKPRTVRTLVICFLINLFVCIDAHAQYGLRKFELKQSLPISRGLTDTSIRSLAFRTFTLPNTNVGKPVKVIAENYYANNLSFFCQKELQVEKATKVPLRFRVGSVSYTDKMEGKNQPAKDRMY
jgi:hypothetical protein